MYVFVQKIQFLRKFLFLKYLVLDLPGSPLFRKTTPQTTTNPSSDYQNFGAGMTWHLDQEVAIFSELRELLPTTGLDFELMEIGGHAVRHFEKETIFLDAVFLFNCWKFKGTYILPSPNCQFKGVARNSR